MQANILPSFDLLSIHVFSGSGCSLDVRFGLGCLVHVVGAKGGERTVPVGHGVNKGRQVAHVETKNIIPHWSAIAEAAHVAKNIEAIGGCKEFFENILRITEVEEIAEYIVGGIKSIHI